MRAEALRESIGARGSHRVPRPIRPQNGEKRVPGRSVPLLSQAESSQESGGEFSGLIRSPRTPTTSRLLAAIPRLGGLRLAHLTADIDSMKARTRDAHLVLRFAAASLAAFVLVGSASMVVMTRYARARAESTGVYHTEFVATAILAPALAHVDLSHPVTGPEYERLRSLVQQRVMSDGRTVRVKIWRPDGTIVFSDDRRLVGQRFPGESEELQDVMGGEVSSGVSDLQDAENADERDLADKLFFTYTPLRTEPGGPVVAVAEIYQDYAFIQSDLNAIAGRMAVMFGAGLLVLYIVLLPLVLGVSRELRRRNERLNELLASEQQRVAELEDLHRKKNDFVAAASHELRTPLTSIIGYLSTLRRSEFERNTAVRDEFLEAAENQAKRLVRLITNLLSQARLEAGSRSVVIEQVDLAAMIQGVVAELPGAQARVSTHMPKEIVVPTDRGRITEVLMNLLDNALKYSGPSSPVEVGASKDAHESRLWVTDYGIGIPAEEQAAVFDRFYQVDQSATRSYGGIGLGLHLAKGSVEELGGRIEISSTPASGSTFTVVLPFGRLPEEADLKRILSFSN